MANNVDRIAKSFSQAFRDASRKKTSGYDTQATVTRVDGKTAWVHIPGGVDETPVSLTINAKAGDNVQVRVSGGRAWLTGNTTAPPTDDVMAVAAVTKADSSYVAAVTAQRSAVIAAGAASAAQESANAAQASADAAMESATVANTAANGALTQLSVVEDVVGVLTWITDHGTYAASTDTVVAPGKFYFTRSGSAGSYTYTVVTNPTGNPSTSGYYELSGIDEAVSNYVSSHLALTDAGLWVVKDNQGYKALLANDGMKIYNATGNLIAKFGESIGIYDVKSGIGDNTNGVLIGTDGIEYENTDIRITLDPTYGEVIKSKTNAGDASMYGLRVVDSQSNYVQVLPGAVFGYVHVNNENIIGFNIGSGWNSVAGRLESGLSLGDARYGGRSISLSSASPDITIITNTDSGILQTSGNNGSGVYNLIRNHNNGDISVSASGGGLYLGYENTTLIDLLNGCHQFGTYYTEITNANSPVWLRVRNGVGGNAIFIQANTTGTVELASYGTNGTRYGILARANNSNAITAYGDWTYTGSAQVSTGTNDARFIVACNVSGYASRNAIVLDAYTNGTIRIGSQSADGTSRPILDRANNSNAITAYGTWTFNAYDDSGRVVVSRETSGYRVSRLESADFTQAIFLGISGQWGQSTYTVRYAETNGSDVRLKENIEDCEISALPVINNIRIRQFDWRHNKAHQVIGVIADELEQIDKHLAVGGGYTKDGYMSVKSVDTFYLLCYAIKAIQELSAEVNRLKGAA